MRLGKDFVRALDAVDDCLNVCVDLAEELEDDL